MASFVVKNTNDSGPGSLREAIADANARQEPSVIEFKIGSGPQTIVLAQELPELTGRVSVDGSTQPGYAGIPLIGIETNGTSLRVRLTDATVQALNLSFTGEQQQGIGLHVIAGSNITIRNLKVSNRSCGIFAEQSQDVRVLDNDLRGSGIGGDWCAIYLSVIRGKALAGGLEVRGNTFGGASGALYLNDVQDLTISDGSVAASQIVLEKTSGLTSMSGASDVLDLRNIRNVTIAGLDLSFVGEKQQGIGLRVTGGLNVTIKAIRTANRQQGVVVTNVRDVRALDCDFSRSAVGNNQFALWLHEITAGSLPGGVEVRGNTFGGGYGGLWLQNVEDLMVSDGSVAGSNVVLKGLLGLAAPVGVWGAWDFRNLVHENVNHLDLSFAGEDAPAVGVRLTGRNAAMVLARMISGIEAPHPG